MKKKYLIFIFSLLSANFVFADDSGVNNKTPTVIKSNKINKENDNNIIRAVGDVEIKKDGKILKAKEIEYNQNTKRIKANSNVKVYSEKGGDIFFSKTAEISDDFNNGDFYDGLLIFNNGSDIQSPHINRVNENEIFAYNSNYSICPTNKYDLTINYEEAIEKFNREKTPLFSIKSKKMLDNINDKEITTWHTSIWYWKIPVFYTPYLKIPLSEDTSGIGTPGLEHNSNYGYGIYIPYRFQSKQQRLILKPKIYQDTNYLLNLDYKVKSKDLNKWQINAKGDITNDRGQSKSITNAYGISEDNEGTYKNWRGFISSNGYYNFNDLWAFDYDGTIAGDEYYLRDYHQNSVSYIQSRFTFTKINMKEIENFNYFQFNNLFYQELLEDDSDYFTPRYVPITNTNIQNTIAKNEFGNSYYKIKLNTTDIFRNYSNQEDRTIEYNRFSAVPSLNNTFNSKFGVLNSNLELKTDVYAINEMAREESLYNHNENRVLPQLNLTWKKNFFANEISFEPILKYSGTPNSKSFENKIPNEDSEAQILSFDNIFANNRYAGYDRQEFGDRVTYGFESSFFKNFNFGLAQGYRDNIKHDNNPIVGFDYNYISDYVGYSSYIINNNFDLYYKFLADKDNYKLKTNEVILNYTEDDFSIYIGYVKMDQNLLYDKKQQQLDFGTSVKLYYRWKLDFSAKFDLENSNRMLESKSGLTYDGGCTVWGLSYRTYNPLSQTKKTTSINLDFKIKFI